MKLNDALARANEVQIVRGYPDGNKHYQGEMGDVAITLLHEIEKLRAENKRLKEQVKK